MHKRSRAPRTPKRLVDELEGERACARMLRRELGAADERIRELEAELDAARLALAIRARGELH